MKQEKTEIQKLCDKLIEIDSLEGKESFVVVYLQGDIVTDSMIGSPDNLQKAILALMVNQNSISGDVFRKAFAAFTALQNKPDDNTECCKGGECQCNKEANE